MAISNELSGDIAAAILGGRKLSTVEMRDLKETIFKIHSTLQQLSQKTRQDQAIDKTRRVDELPSREALG